MPRATKNLHVPCVTSSASQAQRGPTAVLLPRGAGGLRSDSVAACHQVTTLDRSKLGQRLGALPPELLRAVEEGLMAALGLI